VAVLLSMAALLHLANDPAVRILGRKRGTHVFRAASPEHPDDETFPGLVIAKTEGRMYFGNAPVVAEKLRLIVEREKPRVLLLDCGAVPDFEFTALKMLDEAEKRIREGGSEVWLAALNPQALEVVRRTPLAERLGDGRMFFTVEDAVEAYLKRSAIP
jgi:MFS superfamily sulfate permease-like transporter